MEGMSKHIQEAFVINRERAPLYNKISGGRSMRIHRRLIWGQFISTYTSKIPDLWAKYFHNRGIPIMELDFVPMDAINEFSENFPFPPQPVQNFVQRDMNQVLRDLKIAYKKNSYEGLSKAAHQEILELESAKTFHHMYRHVLESLVRIANHAPLHEKRAIDKELFLNPIWLSKYLIAAHLSVLKFVYKLDKDFSPIQADNIPILFNDIPPVPAYADFYRVESKA